jgi:4-hydroxy-3-polyprenylbenzoate decarboxylase
LTRSDGGGDEHAADRLPWVVGVSGASGTPYAASVLRGLLAAGEAVDLVVSRAARLTLLDETGVAWRDGDWLTGLREWLGPGGLPEPGPGAGAGVGAGAGAGADSGRPGPAGAALAGRLDELVRHYSPGDLAAPPSSGSYPTRGMIVVPASTANLAGIALGLSKDLLQRAADVTLKERRRLVVVPREMPFTRSTLVHMLTLHDAGAVVAAASPGFYAGAQSASELADFVAGRVLDAAGVPHHLYRRWTGELGGARRP